PDLKDISELLNIIRTRRDKTINEISETNPYMVGFPCVAFSKFINVLIDNGYTVIVIDQIGKETELGTKKIIIKRGVTGIYSAGTYIDKPQKTDTNFIVSIYIEDEVQKSGKFLTCI